VKFFIFLKEVFTSKLTLPIYSRINKQFMEYKRRAKTPFHAAYTLLHDAIVKKGFLLPSGEVSLPFKWDESSDIVSLKYSKNEKSIEVKCLLMNNSMVVNIIYNNDLKTLDFPISDYVENFDEAQNTYETRSLGNFERKVCEDILEPLFPELKPTGSTTSTATERPRTEPQPQPQVPDPLRDERFHPRAPRIVDPFAVGGADLDPFGNRGGGGMIMDPMRGRLPMMGRGWGGVPPGARYDPIGPGGRGPDNDDLLPPGRRNMFDHDDMFM